MTIVVVANHRSDDAPSAVIAGCTPMRHEGWAMARIWNEALLDAVRLDVPSPTVHARNLHHSSAAMWDVWAGHGPLAAGVYVDEDRTVDGGVADDVIAAREEAGISRLYDGIHVWADDLRGRVVGSEAGRGAWVLAERYFDGTIDER